MQSLRERLLRAEALHRGDPLKAPEDVVADLAQLLLALLLEDEELAKHQLNYAQREDDGNQRREGRSREMPTIFHPVMDTATVVLTTCIRPKPTIARVHVMSLLARLTMSPVRFPA